jgi:hypothetical protein
MEMREIGQMTSNDPDLKNVPRGRRTEEEGQA